MSDPIRSRGKRDLIPLALLCCSLLGGAWLYGVLSAREELFPYPQLRALVRQARTAVDDLAERAALELPLYYVESPAIAEPARIHSPDLVSDSLLLVSGMGPDKTQFVRIIDNSGVVLHSWDIDWFELWPNPDHVDEEFVPRARPGTSIHGIVLMPDGGLVFNFENLGLLRLDHCGAVVWRLPYRTHHSIHVDDAGNIWVGGLVTRREADPRLPNYFPPFEDPALLQVSPDGKLQREISVFDLLLDNGRSGLLYLSTINNWGTAVTGDTLHLNDIEIFPAAEEPGVFGPGDILLSLRNLNAIFVLDQASLRIKYENIGSVLRQHDPDFVDGNTISVLDNHNLSAAWDESRGDQAGLSSRIVSIDARTDEVTVVYQGTGEQPFFTDIMGKHQWIGNGNLLVTESRAGRVFELTPSGEVAWEYFNVAGEKILGLIDDAQRLPPEIDAAALAQLGKQCER